ncbi:MAG: hypothetical protein SCL54_09785 [Bacillota bacterium]|nr:hypothetical protein [Bacillota bacterium]
MKVNEFPYEVIEELKYYVYRLIDPRNGETFYVGKGFGNRVFSHMNSVKEDIDLDEFSDKLQTIRAIHLAGLDVIHVIHRHGMDEATSLAVEAALIDAYPSATNIMGGTHSNDVGPMHAIEIIDKYKSEEIEFRHKVIMINVNKSKIERKLYDAVRHSWKLNVNKAKNAEYALAVTNGIVVGVFKPTKWLSTTSANFPDLSEDVPNRFGFIGEEASEEIKSVYMRRRVPNSYRKKGASNPIRYNY